MKPAAVGIAEHLGWAWFVTVALDEGRAVLLDSRRLELVGEGLPCMPFHHDTDGMELVAADRLLAEVRTSAWDCARSALRTLSQIVAPGHAISVLSIRHPPLLDLPDSVAASRVSHHINNRADGMMYNQALCAAAEAAGIRVVSHKRGEEERLATGALRIDPAALRAMIAELGTTASNWTKEHRAAAAAALAALAGT